MKVKATKLGYYGDRRRREGDVFFIKSEEELSQKWMEVLEEKAEPPKKKKAKAKAKAKPKVEESKDVDSDLSVI